MKYTKEHNQTFISTFNKYEEMFGVNLFSAWDFEAVDWLGLSKEAEKCIELNTPLTDEQKAKFFPELEDGKIY